MTIENHRFQNTRGVALIMCLLLLMMFTVMTLSIVIATNSDTLIDGYYRNARGAFWPSDTHSPKPRKSNLPTDQLRSNPKTCGKRRVGLPGFSLGRLDLICTVSTHKVREGVFSSCFQSI